MHWVNYLVKEELIFLLAKYFQHSSTMFMFMTWKTCDEILHIHVSTESGLSQGQLLLFLFDLRDCKLTPLRMTGSPSPSTISVPRTFNIELMAFRLRSFLGMVLSDANFEFSVSWGAMVGILIQVCS